MKYQTFIEKKKRERWKSTTGIQIRKKKKNPTPNERSQTKTKTSSKLQATEVHSPMTQKKKKWFARKTFGGVKTKDENSFPQNEQKNPQSMIEGQWGPSLPHQSANRRQNLKCKGRQFSWQERTEAT